MSSKHNTEAAIGTVAGVVLLVGASLYVALSRPSAADPPQSGDTPPARQNVVLDRTVLYKSRVGFSVCTRSSLHRCELLFARSDAGDRATIRIGPVDIEPVQSCESIGAAAQASCADAGVSPLGTVPEGGFGPDVAWIQCAARHGLVYRGGANTSTVDPRDEDRTMRPGELRLVCDEGHLSAQFENTL